MTVVHIVDAPGYERDLPVKILLAGYPAVDSRGELSVVEFDNGEIEVVSSSLIREVA